MTVEQQDPNKALGAGKTCFVIGPIGSKLKPPGTPERQQYEESIQMWEEVFQPAIETFGMKPVRADKLVRSGEIPEQIFTLLRDAEVVLADVSRGNANVMYELGIRHSRPDVVTIQVGEDDRLPFDVQAIRTLLFLRTESGLISLRNELVKHIGAALAGEGDQLTATRILQNGAMDYEAVVKTAVNQTAQPNPSEQAEAEEDERGVLELLVEGEEALEDLVPVMEEFSAHMTDLGEATRATSDRLDTSEKFAERLTLIKKYDTAIQDSVQGLERTSAEFLRKVEQLDFLVRYVADEAAASGEVRNQDEFDGMARPIIELSTIANESAVQIAGILEPVRNLRKMSKMLQSTSRSVEHSSHLMIRGAKMVAEWGDLFKPLTLQG